MIAFTGISRQPMSAHLRDLLWEVWRAPVFDQFRGFQGELLGAECEAFAGLHYDPEVAVWEERDGPGSELLVTSLANIRHPAWRLATGYRGRVEHAACDCGSTLPRVVWE
jgi:phenylacetate-coenzyme A ligase PaaK-like adenylate-forming protein